jgi:hydrogenase expression/formation protein HypE
MKDKVTLAHGGGGRATQSLINELIVKELGNSTLNKLDDSAVLSALKGKFAFTTDSYVVQPIFFRGADIGKLSVCGTVNDLSMAGAKPLYISLGLIIEEGFSFDDLSTIVRSIKAAAKEAKVQVVCGDTKVVERGSADKIFINTSGIGKIISKRELSNSNVEAGDVVVLSGSIGDHGVAVLSQRKGIEFKTSLKSDCAPLNGLVEAMLSSGARINCMRDPTRGGLATILNEVAERSGVGIEIDEERVPIKDAVRGACELLGLDPLYIANEGKLAAFVSERDSEKLLIAMKKHKYGLASRVVGRVTKENRGTVILNTSVGGRRILENFSGEMLPRIC